VCGPTANACEYVTVAPETTGGGAAAPSMVAPTIPARDSLPTTERDAAESTVEPSGGVDEERPGFVLSTVRSSTGADAAELPALSVATTRRS
jgi:hypothetical protein